MCLSRFTFYVLILTPCCNPLWVLSLLWSIGSARPPCCCPEESGRCITPYLSVLKATRLQYTQVWNVTRLMRQGFSGQDMGSNLGLAKVHKHACDNACLCTLARPKKEGPGRTVESDTVESLILLCDRGLLYKLDGLHHIYGICSNGIKHEKKQYDIRRIYLI